MTLKYLKTVGGFFGAGMLIAYWSLAIGCALILVAIAMIVLKLFPTPPEEPRYWEAGSSLEGGDALYDEITEDGAMACEPKYLLEDGSKGWCWTDHAGKQIITWSTGRRVWRERVN